MKEYHNEYLHNCNLNNIDIYKLQKSLKNNEIVELDLENNANIIIAKNEIYVKRWEPGNIPLYLFKDWSIEMYDDYEIYSYVFVSERYYDYYYKDFDFENYDYQEYYCMKIMQRLINKCNYSFNEFAPDRKKSIEIIKEEIEDYFS